MVDNEVMVILYSTIAGYDRLHTCTHVNACICFGLHLVEIDG